MVFRKWSFINETHIYMLFDYVCGGELFSYLRTAGYFPSSTSSYDFCNETLVKPFLT